MFTKTLALLVFPALAVAQYGYAPAPGSSSSASATSSASAVAPSAPPSTAGQINIDVAAGGKLVFSPSNITAIVGTLVTFYFPNSGIKHSVTQSTFADPCTYLAANTTGGDSNGFDSGLSSSEMFTINITDTAPIWYFCKQVSHCGTGMVGSINAPTSGNTYEAFQSAAKQIGSNEPVVTSGGPVLSGVGATATGPPVSDASGTSSAASTSSTSSSSGAMKVTTSIGFALFAAVLAVAMA